MRTRVSLLLGVVAALLFSGALLISCQGGSSSAEKSSDDQEKSSQSQSTETIVWKSSGHGPANDPSQIYHDKMCKAITEASGGRLKIKPFVGGSIVPAYEEFDAVDKGVLDMAYTCPMYDKDKFPAAGLISARPNGLPGEALRTWFDEGGGWKMLNEMISDYNVRTFPGALSPLPQEVFFHSNVKVENMKDLKQLKARAMGDGGEILKRLGVSTVIIPGGELYEAMSRGTIDAMEYSTLASNWNMKFQEVSDYTILSPVRAPSDPQVVYVNKDSWNELPDDLKRLVKDVVSKYTQAQHQYLVHKSLKSVQKFEEAGNEVYQLPQDVEDAIRKEARAYYEEKAAEEGGIYKKIYYSMREYWESYSSIPRKE